MKNQNITFIRILLAVACCIMLVVSKVKGQIPFRFVYQGTTYSDPRQVSNFPTFSSTENCPSNHKDPGGANYEHCHPTYDFGGFTYLVGTDNVTITAAMSDLAWSNSYVGYTYVSGSTFALNCYAYATGAPVPMGDGAGSAWFQWTTPYTRCSGATKSTSYLISDKTHCVVFEEYPEDCWYIDGTFEKNASGPVWSLDGDITLPDDLAAMGQNLQ
jgi:hypothetical protein